MTNLSDEAATMNWLVTSFAEDVPGVVDAVVVSSDGLPLAFSDGIGRAGGDQLAAVTSGLTSLTDGAARCFGGGDVCQIVVELQAGFMLFMRIGDGSALAVLATKACDIGLVGYEMSMLAKRMGPALSPALVTEMQSTLART